ncbi:alpha/beta hydrolase [Streptomyces sp. AJS327]|nr:alpha/beta hydrolase [Streptomyces sp. AJS327]
MGRALGSTASAPHAVVLVLAGGTPRGSRRRAPAAQALAYSLARRLAHGTRGETLRTHTVHYRHSGWNGVAAHPAQDARWAADEVVRRYGDVAVCLVGMDVGARAALRAAGHPAVSSVVALAPWFPEPDSPDADPAEELPDPVHQLAGRQVLIVHGSDDHHTDPDLSFRLAERARRTTSAVCRFEVHTDGHSLRQHHSEVTALTRDFVLGSLCGRDFARPVTDAFAAPPPLGLRMPLAAGFGRSLRP